MSISRKEMFLGGIREGLGLDFEIGELEWILHNQSEFMEIVKEELDEMYAEDSAGEMGSRIFMDEILEEIQR